MKKAIPAIYFVLCFISIGILSLCWFDSNEIYDRIQRRELTPYKMEQISEDETDI